MAPPALTSLKDPAHFRLLLEVRHTDLLSFVQEYYLAQRSPLVWAHYLLSLFATGALLWSGVVSGAGPGDWWKAIGWASLAFLALIPIHEAIHALVYWLLGARDIRFGASLRMLAVYAVAHNFVVGPRAFAILALAPFLAINGFFALLAILNPGLRLFSLVVSLLHLSAVSGDWALLNFYWTHPGAAVYTYDDADAGVSFFYQSSEAA